MNIREFIESKTVEHNNMLRSMPASEVLLRRTTGIDWETEFQKQGYVSIKKLKRSTPDEIFDWCATMFGKDHYITFYRSSGSSYTFWFDSPQNATMFRIRWS